MIVKFACDFRAWQDVVLNRISALVGVGSLVGVYLLARHEACYQASSYIFSHINMKSLENIMKF